MGPAVSLVTVFVLTPTGTPTTVEVVAMSVRRVKYVAMGLVSARLVRIATAFV